MIEKEIINNRPPHDFMQCACDARVSPETRCGKTGPDFCDGCREARWGKGEVGISHTCTVSKGGIMAHMHDVHDIRTLFIGISGDTVP
jgi:hypothetical protein